MVDHRKDVYRHLGTHCGGELGKKTQRNGPDWLGLFAHPGRPSKSQAVIGILLIRLF